MNPLAARLICLLNVTHAKLGLDPEPLVGLLEGAGEVELHELSPCGAMAFVGDYVLAAWPDDERGVAAPRGYRLMSRRLRERGFTRHMVHPLNFRSVKLTRKMGAKPLGVDEEGFVHYLLKSEDFPHPQECSDGQKVATSEAT